MASINYEFYKGEDLYSDGDIENEILQIVQDEKKMEEALKYDSRWPVQYHINPNRWNILNVCDISPDDVCLEIGGGCGAVSSGILRYSEHLDSVDLSKRRSLINYTRNQKYNDFTIYVGNFNDVVLNKKYDKIFLIGVLEYSKLYFPEEKDPFTYMLKKVKGLLKEGGKLFIAIENKYGMKYFSGAGEDHSGKIFQGMEGYKGICATTFSHDELNKIILSSGYKDTFFYYPLPDYKFPEEIFSDKYLPEGKSFTYLGKSYDRDRYILFDENKAMREAAKSDDFKMFANSFMVECW